MYPHTEIESHDSTLSEISFFSCNSPIAPYSISPWSPNFLFYSPTMTLGTAMFSKLYSAPNVFAGMVLKIPSAMLFMRIKNMFGDCS